MPQNNGNVFVLSGNQFLALFEYIDMLYEVLPYESKTHVINFVNLLQKSEERSAKLELV